MEIVEPNEDMIAITRLFLERLDSLNEDERSAIAEAIKCFANPVFIAGEDVLPIPNGLRS